MHIHNAFLATRLPDASEPFAFTVCHLVRLFNLPALTVDVEEHGVADSSPAPSGKWR
jgi:hypothetical protein